MTDDVWAPLRPLVGMPGKDFARYIEHRLERVG